MALYYYSMQKCADALAHINEGILDIKHDDYKDHTPSKASS
jgi:hypothetical protein